MTIKQHHIRSLLSRYTYSSSNSSRRNRSRRHRHYTRRTSTRNDASLFNNAVSRYLNLQGFGHGPSKNKRYGPILDPSLLINNTYADNNNGGDSEDDDVIEPKLDKYYISNFLSFLPEDLVKDVMSQRINSRQSTILKYLRQTYDCYPPQIYKLVTGHRLSNKDLRQYRLRQHNHHHDTNQPPASLPPTPTQAPVPPPMDDNEENVDAATQLEQLMHDYHSAESVMADVFDEMSRVVANTVATPPPPPTTAHPPTQRIAHKAIPPPSAAQSYIPHKQMMPPSAPQPHIPYKQMPPPTPPPSSSSPSSSSSSLSPPPSVPHDEAQQQQLPTNHYQDLLDSMDMYLNNLPSSSPSNQEQQQQQPQSFTNVLNAYCDGYFNAKETVNEVLHVAQQYLMNTWDKQGGGM